jgi:hypothetical protein
VNDDQLRRQLPPERSLPADRRRQMEGRLMARIGEEETRDHTRFRILAGVAAAVLAVAAVAAAVIINRDDDPERVDTRPAQTSENSTTTTAGTTTPTTRPAPPTSGSPGAKPPPTSSPGAAGGAVDGAGGTNADSPGIPADANSGEVADVDGDGHPDTLWLAPPAGGVAGRPMGIVTAAGGRVETRVESAAPIPLSVLVVDVDLTPPVELLVSDGRLVQLWAFADCALAQVTDPDGAPYNFDLGQRIGTGTGVGCAGPGDDRRLVGLNIIGDDGTTVRWERTTITRDGLVADEGETESGTFTRPDDDARIELLNGVSCGDLTLADDGISQPGIQPGG